MTDVFGATNVVFEYLVQVCFEEFILSQFAMSECFEKIAFIATDVFMNLDLFCNSKSLVSMKFKLHVIIYACFWLKEVVGT